MPRLDKYTIFVLIFGVVSLPPAESPFSLAVPPFLLAFVISYVFPSSTQFEPSCLSCLAKIPPSFFPPLATNMLLFKANFETLFSVKEKCCKASSAGLIRKTERPFFRAICQAAFQRKKKLLRVLCTREVWKKSNSYPIFNKPLSAGFRVTGYHRKKLS